MRLAEVVAWRRRTEKEAQAHSSGKYGSRRTVQPKQVTLSVTWKGKRTVSSQQSTYGWSGDEEGRQQVVRQYELRRQVVMESRRGYAVGAAWEWDEGNT